MHAASGFGHHTTTSYPAPHGPEREVAQLRIELRTTQEVLASRDSLLDGYKRSVEELRDQLMARELALAGTQQKLRAAESERQLLAAQVERLEMGVRRASEQHTTVLSSEAERREQEVGALRSDRDEQVSSLRSRLHEMATQLDGARGDLRELLAERGRLMQEAETAQRAAQESSAEADTAQRAAAASERTLADVREERRTALTLRDDRIRELQAQVIELGRLGDSKSLEQQTALSTWMSAYNSLRGTVDRQTGELEAAQRAERRSAGDLAEAERRLREANVAAERQGEVAAALRGELQRMAAAAGASEMEVRSLRREVTRAWTGGSTGPGPAAAQVQVPQQQMQQLQTQPQQHAMSWAAQPMSTVQHQMQQTVAGGGRAEEMPRRFEGASGDPGMSWQAATAGAGASYLTSAVPAYGYAATAPMYPGPHVSGLTSLSPLAWGPSAGCRPFVEASCLDPNCGRGKAELWGGGGAVAHKHLRGCKSASSTPVKATTKSGVRRSPYRGLLG